MSGGMEVRVQAASWVGEVGTCKRRLCTCAAPLHELAGRRRPRGRPQAKVAVAAEATEGCCGGAGRALHVSGTSSTNAREQAAYRGARPTRTTPCPQWPADLDADLVEVAVEEGHLRGRCATARRWQPPQGTPVVDFPQTRPTAASAGSLAAPSGPIPFDLGQNQARLLGSPSRRS